MSLDRFLGGEDEDDNEEEATVEEAGQTASDEGGVSVPTDPPDLKRRTPISHPYRNHSIGQVVYVYNRGGGVNGYFTPRNREGGKGPLNPSGGKNYFEIFDSYPITTSVIGKLQSYEVERIFLLERESARVFEYTIDQYLNAPEYVDERGSGEEDTQLCPALSDSLTVWNDMSPSRLWSSASHIES